MSTSKYKFEYSPHLTILGLIFFCYVIMSGWGTDPSKYDNINDPAMDCKAILNEVDRVGIVEYIGNGKPDASQHYYTRQQPEYYPNHQAKR